MAVSLIIVLFFRNFRAVLLLLAAAEHVHHTALSCDDWSGDFLLRQQHALQNRLLQERVS